MRQGPLVSIIINNYNYGGFLAQAINSALDQTYANIEVLVVDDGSTDDSRQIIANYSHCIAPVLKDNGGQASALNAGFARSRGEVVIFLDADDMLLPDIVQRVVNVFESSPDIARVQYRLKVIDTMGNPTGAIVPPVYMPMPSGDLRQHIMELNNYGYWPPTSGNAFSAWSLSQIFPIPELPFRLCADYYLARANSLCAPIVSLDEVGACYRFHGSNNYHASRLNLKQVRMHIQLTHHAHGYIKSVADSLGIRNYPPRVEDVHDVLFAAQRMTLLKLDVEQGVEQGDRLLALFWRGVTAAIRRTGLPLHVKLLYLLWFTAMVPAPRPLAHPLAEKLLVPEARGHLNKLFAALRRGSERPGSA